MIKSVLAGALASLIGFGPFSAAIAAKVTISDPVYDEFEGDDLILALIRDGRLDEAGALMGQRRGTGAERLRLEAELKFAREDWPQAAEALRQVTELQPTALSATLISQLREKLAVAYSHLGKHSACANSFDRVSHPLSDERRILRSRCLASAKRSELSWQVLQTPAFSMVLEREKVDRLLEWSLDSSAENLVLKRMSAGISTSEILQWAEVFAGHGRTRAALRLLEIARLQEPMNPDVLVAWAQLSHAQGFQIETAEAFSRASESDPKFHFHAAELFRQAGRKDRALPHGLQITDGDQKLKHKVALAVDQGNFEGISSLSGPLRRSTLLRDDEVKYALGYALSRRGDRDQALEILQKITSASLSAKAEALRQSLIPRKTR